MPEQALRTEQYGTVVEFQPLAFGKTRSQVHLILPGEIRPEVQAATFLQRFGMGIGLCTGVEGVAGVGQLGQHDQVGTFTHCPPGQCQASAQVTVAMLEPDLGVVLDDGDAYGADGGQCSDMATSFLWLFWKGASKAGLGWGVTVGVFLQACRNRGWV